MGEINDRPVIFALSNPNSKSEAVPQAVYEWTDGRALMATGSPFPDVNYGGKTITIGQCNNAFIFPGVGLATKVCRPRMVTPEMFAAAAYALADCIDGERLQQGTLFPSQNRLREVSQKVATAACEEAVKQGLSEAPSYTEWGPRVVEAMWEARYHKYRFEP
jgi:malic enzyme